MFLFSSDTCKCLCCSHTSQLRIWMLGVGPYIGWRAEVWRVSGTEAKWPTCWHGRDSWQERERDREIIRAPFALVVHYLSLSSSMHLLTPSSSLGVKGSIRVRRWNSKLMPRQTVRHIDSQRRHTRIWKCLDCGKREPAASQCGPCSRPRSAGWSRGQTHCLRWGGGKVSAEETRLHSPLSLPCDVLNQQVPHWIHGSPPCIGLCTHHSFWYYFSGVSIFV